MRSKLSRERIQCFQVDTGKESLQMCYLDDRHATDFHYFDIDNVETDAIRWSVLNVRYGSNTGAMEIAIFGVPVD